MPRHYDAHECRRKADQHWELAGLARQDLDPEDANRHTKLAQTWEVRAHEGGYTQGETPR